MSRVIFVIIILVVSSQNAFAYLDPGTGSMIFQVMIAGLLGLTYLLKTEITAIWHRMVSYLKGGNDE